jgi:hypothetical protein
MTVLRCAICFCLLLACGLLSAGCRQDMHDQPRYKPLAESDFFEDGRASRPQVPGTVARGQLRTEAHLYTGKIDGELATTLPFPVTRAVLERGRERYDIYCTPCHDRVGSGQGMIVRRGFRRPPSLHIDRLRQVPVAHFFEVISNGFGAMLDYAAQLTPDDRWAVAAYMRALQLSQYATLADVPADVQPQLQSQNP